MKRLLTAGILVLTLHYLVPYTLLEDSKSPALLVFWTALAALWGLVISIYLERGWGK